MPRELWLQYEDLEHYRAGESALFDLLKEKEGRDTVIIYLKKEKARKILPANWRVEADKDLLDKLTKILSEKNVKLVEKGIEKQKKMI